MERRSFLSKCLAVLAALFSLLLAPFCGSASEPKRRRCVKTYRDTTYTYRLRDGVLQRICWHYQQPADWICCVEFNDSEDIVGWHQHVCVAVSSTADPYLPSVLCEELTDEEFKREMKKQQEIMRQSPGRVC